MIYLGLNLANFVNRRIFSVSGNMKMVAGLAMFFSPFNVSVFNRKKLVICVWVTVRLSSVLYKTYVP